MPGKNGGNIALISTTSASGITIDSTRLENNAYSKYAQEGVPNWLVAAAGGTTTVNFRNQNSQTQWDLTGEETTTTELYGNLYCAAASGSGMWASAAGALDVHLENSEWHGSIENCGDGVSLNLDGISSWIVTGTCTVQSLNLSEGASITAADGYTLSFQVDGVTRSNLPAGSYQNVQVIVTSNGKNVYSGIYSENNSMDVTGPAEEAGAAQDGMMPGGDMGGGMPGGPEDQMNSAAVSNNCTHKDDSGIIQIDCVVADPSIAAIRFEGHKV